jgi:hypothetical protein
VTGSIDSRPSTPGFRPKSPPGEPPPDDDEAPEPVKPTAMTAVAVKMSDVIALLRKEEAELAAMADQGGAGPSSPRSDAPTPTMDEPSPVVEEMDVDQPASAAEDVEELTTQDDGSTVKDEEQSRSDVNPVSEASSPKQSGSISPVPDTNLVAVATHDESQVVENPDPVEAICVEQTPADPAVKQDSESEQEALSRTMSILVAEAAECPAEPFCNPQFIEMETPDKGLETTLAESSPQAVQSPETDIESESALVEGQAEPAPSKQIEPKQPSAEEDKESIPESSTSEKSDPDNEVFITAQTEVEQPEITNDGLARDSYEGHAMEEDTSALDMLDECPSALDILATSALSAAGSFTAHREAVSPSKREKSPSSDALVGITLVDVSGKTEFCTVGDEPNTVLSFSKQTEYEHETAPIQTDSAKSTDEDNVTESVPITQKPVSPSSLPSREQEGSVSPAGGDNVEDMKSPGSDTVRMDIATDDSPKEDITSTVEESKTDPSAIETKPMTAKEGSRSPAGIDGDEESSFVDDVLVDSDKVEENEDTPQPDEGVVNEPRSCIENIEEVDGSENMALKAETVELSLDVEQKSLATVQDLPVAEKVPHETQVPLEWDEESSKIDKELFDSEKEPLQLEQEGLETERKPIQTEQEAMETEQEPLETEQAEQETLETEKEPLDPEQAEQETLEAEQEPLKTEQAEPETLKTEETLEPEQAEQDSLETEKEPLEPEQAELETLETEDEPLEPEQETLETEKEPLEPEQAEKETLETEKEPLEPEQAEQETLETEKEPLEPEQAEKETLETEEEPLEPEQETLETEKELWEPEQNSVQAEQETFETEQEALEPEAEQVEQETLETEKESLESEQDPMQAEQESGEAHPDRVVTEQLLLDIDDKSSHPEQISCVETGQRITGSPTKSVADEVEAVSAAHKEQEGEDGEGPARMEDAAHGEQLEHENVESRSQVEDSAAIVPIKEKTPTPSTSPLPGKCQSPASDDVSAECPVPQPPAEPEQLLSGNSQDRAAPSPDLPKPRCTSKASVTSEDPTASPRSRSPSARSESPVLRQSRRQSRASVASEDLTTSPTRSESPAVQSRPGTPTVMPHVGPPTPPVGGRSTSPSSSRTSTPTSELRRVGRPKRSDSQSDSTSIAAPRGRRAASPTVKKTSLRSYSPPPHYGTRRAGKGKPDKPEKITPGAPTKKPKLSPSARATRGQKPASVVAPPRGRGKPTSASQSANKSASVKRAGRGSKDEGPPSKRGRH